MACTNRIQVVLFHQQHVLDHALQRYCLAIYGIGIMPVCALEEYSAVVDEYFPLSVLYFAEAILLCTYIPIE